MKNYVFVLVFLLMVFIIFINLKKETFQAATASAPTTQAPNCITQDYIQSNRSQITNGNTIHLHDQEFNCIDANAFSGLTSDRYDNVEILHLRNNQLTNIDTNAFSELTSLQILDLRDNQLTNIDTNAFSELTSLQILDLRDNQLTSIDANVFTGLTSLETLYLDEGTCIIGDIDPNVNLLSVNWTGSSGRPEVKKKNEFTCPPNCITQVYINKTYDSGTEDIFLSDNFNCIDANAFSRVPNLQTLNLSGNQLTSIDTNAFLGLTSLRTLDLRDNQLTNIPENVFKGLTSLRTLDLRDNQLTNIPENVFKGLTSLEILRLDNNQLRSIDANAFSELINVRKLYLNNNQLTSIDANVFSELTKLWQLYLQNNQLESIPENVFEGLSNLGTVLLYHNNLPNQIDANVFSELPNLELLSLDEGTCIIGDIYPELGVYWIDSSDNRVVKNKDEYTCPAAPTTTQASPSGQTRTTGSNLNTLNVDDGEYNIQLEDGTTVSLVKNDNIIIINKNYVWQRSGSWGAGKYVNFVPFGDRSPENYVITYRDVNNQIIIEIVTPDSRKKGNLMLSGQETLSGQAPTTLAAPTQAPTTLAAPTQAPTTLAPTTTQTPNCITKNYIRNNSKLIVGNTIYLNHQEFNCIGEDPFSEVSNVQILHLHNNQLTSIDEYVFSELRNLQKLYLNNNQLSSIDANAFSGLTNVNELHLHNNQLTSIDADVFKGLTNVNVTLDEGTCIIGDIDPNLNVRVHKKNPSNGQWESKERNEFTCPAAPTQAPTTLTPSNIVLNCEIIDNLVNCEIIENLVNMD